jgi:hydrogenase maturation protein HypF
VTAAPTTERRRLRVTGTVQGVGFRPFVYRHATALGLSGSVCNDSSGVLIDVEGGAADIAELQRRLVAQAPPLARVETVETVVLPPDGGRPGFLIVESDAAGAPDVPVSVDTGACADCLAEVDDPDDRRYQYPFTNCTNCGPRYTIVKSVPYDRPATTMAGFAMCAACRREYDDPGDRRFHAQPNACPDCGPHVSLRAADGAVLADGVDALEATVAALERGQIVAVKGVGGYHLAVDAGKDEAVTRLRRRKERDDKPFALMVPDVESARELCELDPAAQAALASPGRPIVLAPRREPARFGVASGVAPGLIELGMMLPYTPLHHVLVGRLGRPLVMTSGNRSDEPIAHVDADAFSRLGPLVDAVLTHDRPIHIRCDDSVLRASGGRTQLLRRSRGFAPAPLLLASPALRQVLAVGAQLKSTVSVAKGNAIVTSHHIGDLEHPAAYQSFLQAVEHLCRVFGVTPDVIAHDLHPEYLSTKWAQDTDLPLHGVQHHHAHVASCLVEHGHTGRVLGLAFDGLGYGCDRMMWGGEFLDADLGDFERVAHLRPAPLPGGESAIREPWRMALAWTYASEGPDAALREGARLDARAESVVGLVERGGVSETTSVGRLFDAVAALLGARARVSYEGQAAIELEALARTVPSAEAPEYAMDVQREGGVRVLDPAPVIAAVREERDRGTPVAIVAAGFHEGLGRSAARLAAELAAERGLDTAALSGGVFQNARLTEIVRSELEAAGLHVLVHREVPPNDGGISIGQAAVSSNAEQPSGE